MCGIVGARADAVSASRFEAAIGALAWRGPDGSGVTEVGGWRLGVTRLAISESGSEQPVVCRRTGRVAIGNVAFTSAEREWSTFGGRSRNDVELALSRLASDPSSLTATCGPYAFAVVDPDGTVWLGRDPEGEKPLFALVSGRDLLAFASTPSALAAMGYPLEPTQAGLSRVLRFGFGGEFVPRDPSQALLDGLRGGFVARSGAGVQPLAGRLPPEVEAGDLEDEVADLRVRVQGAVQRCAATAVAPVGTLLSGGLDSACIAAALGRVGRRLPGYQFKAVGEPTAERERARAVADRVGLRLREVDGGPGILDELPRLTRAWGLPLGDPSILAAHATARAAAEDGVRVLLTGEGADDLWLGYRRHRYAAWLDRTWFRSRGRHLGWSAPRASRSTWARAWRAATSSNPYEALLEVAPPRVFEAMLQAPWRAARLPLDVERSAMDTSYGMPVPATSDQVLARARFVDRALYLRNDLLPKADVASLAAGVEARCPFLDPAVLTARHLRRESSAVLGKRALRSAFADELPPAVIRGPKLGFGVPLDRWLRSESWLLDLLHEDRTQTRSHIDRSGLRDVLDGHRRGRVRAGHALYLIGAVELWLREIGS